ncbi:MAG TPA: HD domain-containing phosphohydrolase [Thermoleophilaceae bacterium]|nr:HD domain-containing phosphohydrolase [Thermoleophilaceae bacterium]
MAFVRRIAIPAVAALVISALAVHYGHALFGWFADGQYDVIDTWLMDGLFMAAAAIALVGAWRSRGERGPRLLLAAGITSYGLAYVVYHVFLTTSIWVWPTVSDFMWLAFYAATAVWLGAALKREIGRARWLWLDAAVNALALVALGWVFVVSPAADAAVASEAFTIGQASYMVGDLILAGMLAAVVTASGLRGAARWALPIAGVVVLTLSDLFYAWQASRLVDVTGSVLDPLWVTAMVLFAASCWSHRRPAQARGDGVELPLRTAVSPVVGFLALIIVVGMRDDLLAEGLVLLAVGIVCLRLGITLRVNRRLMNIVRGAERTSASQARTDLLTLLGNRRALEADLKGRARSGEPFTLVWLDLNGFKTYNDRFGHAAGDVLLRRLGAALAAATASRGACYRPGGDEFCVLLDGQVSDGDPHVDRILAALSERGAGFAITAAHGLVTIPDEAQDPGEAQRLADQRMYARKRSGRKSTAEEMSELLSRVTAEREFGSDDREHDVGRLAVGVGRQLGCSTEDLDIVARAAEQHDVGKLAIPDAILLKPGPLDAGEWELVRQHPIVGERILAGTPALRPVARVVRSCHENWDGSGYPDALSEGQIPLGARIISVCNAYSAMAAGAPHRAALSDAHAFLELRRCAGRQFDGAVVEALIKGRNGTIRPVLRKAQAKCDGTDQPTLQS